MLHATGIFVSTGRHGGAAGAPAGPAREQHGVLRTNCIDSLDRWVWVRGAGCWLAAKWVACHINSRTRGMGMRALINACMSDPPHQRLYFSVCRTNVAQFTYGMLALGQQLHALGIAGQLAMHPAEAEHFGCATGQY